MGTERTGAPKPDDRVCRALVDAPVPLGRTLARMARLVDAALADCGLSAGQYRALCFLADEQVAAAASRMAEKLAVSRPTITALVDGLVAKGWVERRMDDDDRRRVDHLLTKAGRRALARADRAVDQRLAAFAAPLDEAELVTAIDGIGCWNAALDRTRLTRFGGAGP